MFHLKEATIATAALALSLSAHAATWTGADPNDNLWTTVGNWSNLQEPLVGDTVTFGAAASNQIISYNAQTNDIRMVIASDATQGVTFAGTGNNQLRFLGGGGNVATSATVFTLENGAGDVTFNGVVQSSSWHRWVNNSPTSVVTFNNNFPVNNNRPLVLQGGHWQIGPNGNLGMQVVLEYGAALEMNRTGDLSSRGVDSSDVNTSVTRTAANPMTWQWQIADASFAGTISGNMNMAFGRNNFNDQTVYVLTNDNTWTGTTTVNTGTLVIDGTHVGGGSYNINAKTGNANNNFEGTDGRLAGNGTITLAAGGTVAVTGFDQSTKGNFPGSPPVVNPIGYAFIAPGHNGIGTLTLNADAVIFNDLGVLDIELAASGVSDQLVIGGPGDVVLNPGSILRLLDDGGWFDGNDYVLMQFAGQLTGQFSTVVDADFQPLDLTAFGDFGYELRYLEDSLVLAALPEPTQEEAPAVPEPATLMLGVLVGAALLVRRRR